jgi:ATP synthase protein I
MADRDPGNARARRIQAVKTIGALSTVGLSFVLAIVIGVAAGYYLDRRLGTSPWLFLLGFAFGLAAGVLNVVRISKKFLR